mmetsp:Transcript_23348/g.66934  ORF Transcript_23348/g.66934 Transcript_23348/m.66934 type:complete len:243 (-) Transcript_23348:217-945(-)
MAAAHIVLSECGSPAHSGFVLCVGSDDEDEDVVSVDSDTAVPFDLYMDLINAGERARARGQHHVEPSSNKPHLVHTPVMALPRIASSRRAASVGAGVFGGSRSMEDATVIRSPSASRSALHAALTSAHAPVQPSFLESQTGTPGSNCGKICAEVHLDLGPPDLIELESSECVRRASHSWAHTSAMMASKAASGPPMMQTYKLLQMSASCAAVDCITGLFAGRVFSSAHAPLALGTQDPGELV